MLTLTLTALLALVAAQDEPRPRTTDSAPEDVEIMRRLLVEAIDKTRTTGVRWRVDTPLRVGGELSVVSGLTLSPDGSGGGVVTHSRGFQAPGLGALFSIDAQVPTVQAGAPESTADDSPEKDDAWERVKRQIQTGRKEADETDPLLGTIHDRSALLLTTLGRANQRAWTLDPEAMQAVTDAVLETLATHGKRIRELKDRDSITVAIHFTPTNTTPYISGTHVDSDDASALWGNWVSIYGASQAPAQRVVIQIPFGDLQALNGGGAGQLRRTAGIHRY
jgi:hypothetical protein